MDSWLVRGITNAVRLRLETLLCHVLLCQISPQLPRVFFPFLLLCYYSRNNNLYSLGWENSLSLVKYTFFLCSDNYFMNEINIYYKTDLLMAVLMSGDMPALGKYPVSSADVASSQFWENPSIHFGWHGHCGAMHQPKYVCKRKQEFIQVQGTQNKNWFIKGDC